VASGHDGHPRTESQSVKRDLKGRIVIRTLPRYAPGGLLVLFGGVSILLGWRPEWGIVGIIVFLVGVSFPMHNFWAESGTERMNDFGNFTKNMALVGAALMLVAVPRPWIYGVESPRPVRE
jgi:uncharacterized membrane protein YphA (DoxX/SURF4 family)